MSALFYGVMDSYAGETFFSPKFYSSIEDGILDADIEYGDVLEYYYTFDNVDDLNIVPKCLRYLAVNTIELHEISEFLRDLGKEMTPENFMVFTRTEVDEPDMLTIVSLS